MSRLLQATTVTASPLLLTTGPCNAVEENVQSAVIQVFCIGSRCVLFVINDGGDAMGKTNILRRDCCISFPESTVVCEEERKTSGSEKEIEFSLIKELQRFAHIAKTSKDSDVPTSRGECPQCHKTLGGISAVATLRVEGMCVVLFFVLECDCIVFASFVIDISTRKNNRSDRNGECQLLTARWCCRQMQDVDALRHSHRQLSVPVSAILEEYKGVINSSCTAFSSSKNSRRIPKSVSSRLSNGASSCFILRIAFTRLVGWVEYVHIVWQEGGRLDERSPWRALRGFRHFMMGLLRLETNDSVTEVPGEIRALNWMIFSRDYEQKYPLLAVLHQHALVPGDPFLDRLSVCMISVRQQQRILESDVDNNWVCVQERLHGSCIDGSWCLEALTLAHPSFLLHTTLPCGGLAGDNVDVLGVFLRPTQVMYPISALLREAGVYATWGPLVAISTGEEDKLREFYFSVFTENGEMARCYVGGFVESATCCSVPLPETRRVSSSASGGKERTVAVVLAMLSGGDILFIEVCSSGVQGTRGKLNDVCLVKLVSLNLGTFTSMGINLPQSFGHLYRFVNLSWNNSNGILFLLAAHEDVQTQAIDCGLLALELQPHVGKIMLQFPGTGTMNGSVATKKNYTDMFLVRVGLLSLVQPPGRTDIDCIISSVQHAPLHPLCRCSIVQDNTSNPYEYEVVIFRSGDICLLRRSSPYMVGWSERHNDVLCKRLSRVQWPLSKNTTALTALTLFFTSNSSDICMEVFYTLGDGTMCTAEELWNNTRQCGLQLVLVCRATMIIMTTEGQVVYVSDLYPHLEAVNDGIIEYTDMNKAENLEEKDFSFFACRLRLFASYDNNHFFILSARSGFLPLLDNGHRECFFVFLHLAWCAGEKDDVSPLVTVSVTDVLRVETDGHPLFEFLPPLHVDNYAQKAAAADEILLCVKEMMYTSGAVLYAVPCILTYIVLEKVVNVRGVFGASSTNGHSVLLDMGKFVMGDQKMMMIFAEPTLLQCVRVSTSDNKMVVVVVSFVSGLSLAAVVHITTEGCRWWECQLLTEVPETMGVSAITLVPFVRLITQDIDNADHSLCWLQDAGGYWHSLSYNSSCGMTENVPNVNTGHRDSVDGLQEASQRMLEPFCLQENSVGDVAVWRNKNELFTLRPIH